MPSRRKPAARKSKAKDARASKKQQQQVWLPASMADAIAAKHGIVDPQQFGLKPWTRKQKSKSDSSAMDYFTNAIARMGFGQPSIPEATEYQMVRLSNNYWLCLTQYRNHWIFRRIVDIPAVDMTRAWPVLDCDMSPDDMSKFDRTVKRTYTPLQIRRALKWARLYGGGGALIAIKGHEDILDEPLDYDDVNPNTYLGLIPFDRWVGILPTGQVSDDYKHPADWGLPEYYECTAPDTSQSFRVHASRVLRFIGPEVPTPELQAQIYWGLSVLEVIWEELRKRDNSSFAILNLLFRANLIARVDNDLAQILSGVGVNQKAMQNWLTRMQAQNELMSNQSMMILPKDGALQSVQYSFAGMAEVYGLFQMDIAGAANMPVTRLFGRTITGLGQSNDADERYYEEKIAQDQESDLGPQLDKLYPVICMSTLGEIPDDLDYKFPSIRVLTEEEKAEKADKGSTPVLAAYNAGVIGLKTTLKELKQLGQDTNIFTNITDEAIDEASDEPIAAGEGEEGLGEPEGAEGEEGEQREKGEPEREEGGRLKNPEDLEKVGTGKKGPEELAGKKALPSPERMMKRAAGVADAKTNNKAKAKVLAAEYVRLHNAASKEFTEAFKAVGARMWNMDKAHPLREKNEAFITKFMADYLDRGIDILSTYGMIRPLTVLDSYPNVTGKQIRWLDQEVEKIYRKYEQQWRSFVRSSVAKDAGSRYREPSIEKLVLGVIKSAGPITDIRIAYALESSVSVEDRWRLDRDVREAISKLEKGGKIKTVPTGGKQSTKAYIVDAADHPAPTHKTWRSFDVNIENPAGSTRTGTGPDGVPWAVTMSHDYGELRRTAGVDGDAYDCFLGPDPNAEFVYIVKTLKSPDFVEFDEEKAFLDFPSEAAARSAFFANFDRPEHFGSLTRMPVADFVKHVMETRANPKPLSSADLKAQDAVKHTKEAVKYEDPAKGMDHCHDCKYFEAPTGCQIVQGKISPDGWCKEFKSK